VKGVRGKPEDPRAVADTSNRGVKR
jgi:hypothetical protein